MLESAALITQYHMYTHPNVTAEPKHLNQAAVTLRNVQLCVFLKLPVLVVTVVMSRVLNLQTMISHLELLTKEKPEAGTLNRALFGC